MVEDRGRIQNSGKREKFMEANKTYTCQFSNHTCQRYNIAGFCKILHCQDCVERSGIGVSFSWLLQFLSVFPLKEKDIDNGGSILLRNIERFLPVYKTAFFMFLSNDGRHCN